LPRRWFKSVVFPVYLSPIKHKGIENLALGFYSTGSTYVKLLALSLLSIGEDSLFELPERVLGVESSPTWVAIKLQDAGDFDVSDPIISVV